LVRKLKYKPNEKEFTNSLRLFIGKYPLFPKERKKIIRKEKEAFNKRWSKYNQKNE